MTLILMRFADDGAEGGESECGGGDELTTVVDTRSDLDEQEGHLECSDASSNKDADEDEVPDDVDERNSQAFVDEPIGCRRE